MIKAIIFDCWGTLFTNSQSPHSFEQFANKLGYTLSDRTFVKLFERHFMEATHDDLKIPIKALLDDLKLPRRKMMIKELEDILIDSIPTQIAYPDTMETLVHLKKTYVLTLLTNTFKQGYEGLNQKFGVDKLFSHVITSFESHRIKPDLQLFKDAIAATGCQPSEIIMIGDNFHDDIEPAQRLGLKTILLDRKGRYPEAKNRVTTLKEIEVIISIMRNV
jgi:putative hydrolase of the HAD superfamily